MENGKSEHDLGAIAKLDAIQAGLIALKGVAASRGRRTTVTVEVVDIAGTGDLPRRDRRMMRNLFAENFGAVHELCLVCFAEDGIEPEII